MSSKKDVKTRVVALLQTIEANQGNTEDVEQLKNASSKLLHMVMGQDKVRKEVLAKSSGGVELLLAVLESTADPTVIQNLVFIINELIQSKSSSSKRVTTLINRGATQVLFNILVNVSRDVPVNEELVMSLHQILAKLGPKDRKFEVKARLSGALAVTLNLVRNHANYFKTLQPALYVLKIYANNAVNASQLGKAGAVSYMFRVIQMCGKKHVTHLKLALDILSLLCKSKSNAARLISLGGVALLIGLYNDWHRFDSANRHINIRKSILGVLKQITNLKSGRKSFMEADGIRVLYAVCQETLDCRELEGAITTASVIMRKCLPRSRLPLPSVASPVSFPLPDSDYRRVGVGGGCASDSQEENDDSGSDDDDDEASDSDAVPDSAGTTKPGMRGAGAASFIGTQGGGKRGGSKGSGRKLATAATQRQSFSEYVAQRRKSSGLFSQESLEKDDDELLRIPREHPRTPEELHAAYAKFFPEIFEFNDRFLRELAAMDSDTAIAHLGADVHVSSSSSSSLAASRINAAQSPPPPTVAPQTTPEDNNNKKIAGDDDGAASASTASKREAERVSILSAVPTSAGNEDFDSTQSTLVGSNTLLSLSDSCYATAFGISDSLGSLKLMDASSGQAKPFQENGSRKLPSLAHIHRLKSTDNLESGHNADNNAANAVTPTVSAKTSIPSSPVGAAANAAASLTPTADLTSRRVAAGHSVSTSSPISKSQSWPLAINTAPREGVHPSTPQGAGPASTALDDSVVEAQSFAAPAALGPLKTNGRLNRYSDRSSVGACLAQSVHIKSVSSRPLADLPPPSTGTLQYHLPSPPASLRLSPKDINDMGNPLCRLMIQGGSLARRSVVAELSNHASTSSAANGDNNNDDDDDDFDYEPAKSKRRVSSASTERGTSPSSGAEASPEHVLIRQTSLPQPSVHSKGNSLPSTDSPKVTKRTSRLRPGSYCGLSHGSYIDLDAELGTPDPGLVTSTAKRTNSVGWFNKIAYPDLYGHKPPTFQEPLYDRKVGVQRAKIFDDINRLIHPEDVLNRVVYDQDAIVATKGPLYCGENNDLTNNDETRVGTKEFADHLLFNAQFECGNLRKAIQVREYEYDLILNPDVNSNHHHQWFYFEVSNMEPSVPYRFNIINCEKQNSQFNFGMQPVCFSVFDAMHGNSRWTRVGTDICYYRNHFARSPQTTGGAKGKAYFTSTFTVTFKHPYDVCYLAYHFPYTYTMLMAQLDRWETSIDLNDIYYRRQTLCRTLNDNKVEVLTVTSHVRHLNKETLDQVTTRPYIFLSSRVHPGESNASWLMKGTLQFLLSKNPTARSLRDQYIFKIVPMLNPEGVINGCHRTSLGGEDLNRTWSAPCSKLHAPIYHTKGLLHFLNAFKKPPIVFCDMHGHSRRKNVFLYGCSPSLSWCSLDANRLEDSSYKILPRVLQHIAPSFSIQNSSFIVEKSKESTARVVVWRQFGVNRSYTMESTYCGCDQGPYRGLHVNCRHLEEMGQKFAEGLLKLSQKSGFKSYALTVNLEQAFASHDLHTSRRTIRAARRSEEEATQSEDDDEHPHDYGYDTP